MHYFQLAFLQRMARQLVSDGRYHIAHKKIPSKDGPVQVERRLSRSHVIVGQVYKELMRIDETLQDSCKSECAAAGQ